MRKTFLFVNITLWVVFVRKFFRSRMWHGFCNRTAIKHARAENVMSLEPSEVMF